MKRMLLMAWVVAIGSSVTFATRPEALVKRLKSIGAIPFSSDATYVAPFEFRVAVDDGTSTITVGRGQDEMQQWNGPPHVVSLPFSAVDAARGSSVFAGYGVVLPDGKHDSFSGLNVTDKIVVVFDGFPGNLSNEDRAQFERFSRPRYKALQALARGAKAIVFVGEPESSATVKGPTPSSISEGPGIVAVRVDSEVSDMIFAGLAEGGLDEIRKRLDAGDPHMQGFEIADLELTLASHAEIETRESSNVVGAIPGAGGGSRKVPGYVVLGTRVGSTAQGHGPSVELLVEVGRRLAEKPAATAVVLALWSDDPTIPFAPAAFIGSKMIETGSVLGYINIDALGPLQDDRLFLESVGSSPVWAGLIERVNIVAGFDVEMRDDPFVPADSAVFYSANLPALNLFSGSQSPSGGAEVFNTEELGRLAGFIEGLVRGLAALDQRPEFVAIRRSGDSAGDAAQAKPFTGTVPDYAAEVDGLRLDGVIAGGPAEKAGLREGDIITEFGGKEIGNVYDYVEALAGAAVDKPVRVVYLRDGVSMETIVTPTRRR